jgi:hypothetical protein
MFLKISALERKHTMYKTAIDDTVFPLIEKKQLLNLKTKAMRSGKWFKTLKRIDRVLFDLTIRVVATVRSAKLAKSIFELTRKLEDAIKSGFSNHLKEIGLPLAERVSFTAQKLGNISAGGWVFDSSFSIYLAAMHVNNAKVFRRQFTQSLQSES